VLAAFQPVLAAATDDIADVLVTAAKKAEITPDSLPADFARLTRFVRHDSNGMVLFSDGGSTDGYVRHAKRSSRSPPARSPIRQDAALHDCHRAGGPAGLTFEAMSSALSQRWAHRPTAPTRPARPSAPGRCPNPRARPQNRPGQASDNGDPVIVAQVMQNR